MESKKASSTKNSSVDTKQLLPLMFEMGRLLKSEMYRDGGVMLSFLHIETLRFIEDEGTPSMRDIAEYLKIAPPSATALVNMFVQEGFIERCADSDDRRVVRLRVSTKGTKLLRAIMKKREEAFARVIAPLASDDRHELARILTIITRKS